MSIWCSWDEIGYDVDPPGVQVMHLGVRPAQPQRGEVRSYATGFSNHYPTRDGSYEQPAQVSIAHIPVWCVPGHDDTDDYDTVGEWVRLDVYTAEHDYAAGGKPTGKYDMASVVMDEVAARALAADLLAWADRENAVAAAQEPQDGPDGCLPVSTPAEPGTDEMGAS